MSAVMCTPAVIAADRFAAAVGQSVAVASSNPSQGFHGKKLTSQLYGCLPYSMEAAAGQKVTIIFGDARSDKDESSPNCRFVSMDQQTILLMVNCWTNFYLEPMKCQPEYGWPRY